VNLLVNYLSSPGARFSEVLDSFNIIGAYYSGQVYYGPSSLNADYDVSNHVNYVNLLAMDE